MREKRLDIEEELNEEKKIKETLNKELEALHKKSRVIDSGLKSAEQELEAFQVIIVYMLNKVAISVSWCHFMQQSSVTMLQSSVTMLQSSVTMQ